MPDIELGLRSHLTTAVPAVAGRIYPDRLPDPPVLPALVYQRVSTVRDAAYDGAPEFVEARFQVDVWSRQAAERRAIARAVSAALLGHHGMMGGVAVAIPRQPMDTDEYETDTGLYRAILEFMIWYSEEQTP